MREKLEMNAVKQPELLVLILIFPFLVSSYYWRRSGWGLPSSLGVVTSLVVVRIGCLE